MSGCGCKGHYHNGGCSDVNPVFWRDGRIPVHPTQAEIDAQKGRNLAREHAARRGAYEFLMEHSAMFRLLGPGWHWAWIIGVAAGLSAIIIFAISAMFP